MKFWLGVGVSALALNACTSDTDDKQTCDAELSAEVDTFIEATTELRTLAGEMKAEMAVACHGIAEDLSGSAPPIDGANTTDEELGAVCEAARTALQAAVFAEPDVVVTLQPGSCTAMFTDPCDRGWDCNPASVVSVEGATATLAATLEAHLPAIYSAFEVHGEMVVEAAVCVSGKAVGVAEQVVRDEACAEELGSELLSAFQASTEDSAAVATAVQASASLGGLVAVEFAPAI